MTVQRCGVQQAALAFVAAAALLSGPALAKARGGADTILYDGNIIPMTGSQARVQALAIKDGMILATGTEAQVRSLADAKTRLVDLDGKTVLPGFIDAHGHITMLAQRADFATLDAPPIGGVTTMAALLGALREQALKDPQGWIIGTGYDDAALAEKRHPSRQELDAVSAERPVLAWHVSGHLMALNTKALEMLGILHPEKDPPHGVIRREADGTTASGVLEEGAISAVLAALPKPSIELQLARLQAAQQVYARNGLTTAQDGATSPDGWMLLSEAARRKALFIDIHALPIAMGEWPGIEQLPFNAPYRDRLRIAGVKLMLDGSPQGRTAWLSAPYYQVPHGQGEDYQGYRQVPDPALRAALERAGTHGWQVFVHVNGDAAIQQLIDGVRSADAALAAPLRRTIAIHAQTLRADQIVQMKALDIEPSFFASHTFYWGDWHREVVLGPVRADRISPQRDAIDAGLRPSIHNDTPVVPPDMIRLIWSAVTRRTRSGDILGPAERITPYEALLEVTANAAYAIRDESRKGTLEPGKQADLVILDGDPLTIDRDRLRDLKVVATIKEGRYVYQAAVRP